jgi:hypothetical protein
MSSRKGRGQVKIRVFFCEERVIVVFNGFFLRKFSVIAVIERLDFLLKILRLVGILWIFPC